MKQIILKRPSLKRLDIGIGTQTYSVRQAQNGLSNKRQPLLLRKAFETLILLQALTIDVFKRTGDSRDPLDTVYELMHIEPAISHFPDLTRAHVEQVERRGKENKDWASALREYTGQQTLAWLHDVAKKEKTITHKLALKTKGFLTKIFPTQISVIQVLNIHRSRNLTHRLMKIQIVLAHGSNYRPQPNEEME